MLIAVIATFWVAAADEYCRALALEGGGSYGAYQVGALMQLTNTLPNSDLQWNVVSGVSTGSLNAAGVSLFPMGQESEMVQFLKNVWLSLNGTGSIFSDWNALGAVYGIFNERGMYSTAPLRSLLLSLVTHPPMRNFTVGSTNLDTGRFGTFNESLGENIVEAVMCSAAPPLYFPPQDFQDTTWADGGCVINLDVFSAIERCLDVVDDESKVIVDMIFCTGADLPPISPSPSFHEVYGRASAIKNYDSAMWFAYNAMQAYPRANFRYTIVPSAVMPGGIVPLDFNRTVLEQEMQLGESDVAKLLEAGTKPRDMADSWKRTRYNKVRAFRR